MAKEARNKFTIIDILQVTAGIIFFNAILSWWFTSSPTWGYDGKYLNPSYITHVITNNQLNLTIDQLGLYNGTDPNLPIYIAVNGRVYDVTAGKKVYGKGGAYNKLAGKDASRVYVTGCFMNPGELSYDLRGLDEKEVEMAIAGWQGFFDRHPKYWYVGQVMHEPIVGEPPAPCEHMQFPGFQHQS